MDLDARLKRAFRPLEARIPGVLLWGSHATGDPTPRSDVDVCVVAGPDRDPADVLADAWRHVDPAGLDLDIRVFEELPRYLQGAVLAADHVILARDEPALYEYLYPFRKLWLDQADRQRMTRDEALKLAGGDRPPTA